MLKKLLKNKIWLIAVVTAAIILLIVFGMIFNHNSEENSRSGTGKKTENSQKQDELYSGDGLEVGDETDAVDSIDGSGFWEDSDEQQGQPDDDSDQENKHTENNTNDISENDSCDRKDPEGLEDDILEDMDKTWGEIS